MRRVKIDYAISAAATVRVIAGIPEFEILLCGIASCESYIMLELCRLSALDFQMESALSWSIIAHRMVNKIAARHLPVI